MLLFSHLVIFNYPFIKGILVDVAYHVMNTDRFGHLVIFSYPFIKGILVDVAYHVVNTDLFIIIAINFRQQMSVSL